MTNASGAMRPLRRVLENEAVRAVLCWTTAQYIRLVRLTSRWRTVGGEHPRTLWRDRRPFILCFWHGRLLMMPCCWDPTRIIHMLISRHRDGRLIARTVAHFGIRTAAGSSTRGGTSALRSMVRALRAGEYVGVTPDGPRGPRMRASDGVVHLARLSGAPIVPAAFGIDRRRVLSTWDRFVVALPFGRGVFVWGPPITVGADAGADSIEAARLRVEDALNAVTAEADRLSGHLPVEPAS